MNIRQTLGAALGALVVVSTLAACSAGTGASGAASVSSGGALAMSLPAPSAVALWSAMLDKMKPLATDAGYELVTDDPSNNAQTQVSDWQAWIQRGDVKAIMGYPVQADSLVPVTAEASAASIPVVGYAAPWEGTAAALVSDGHADGEKLGRAAGEWITEHYGQKTVDVGLLGYWDTDFAAARSTGIADGLEASGAHVAVHQGDGTSIDGGNSSVQNILAAAPQTKVWLAIGSDPALGAYQGLLNAGTAPDDDSILLGSIGVDDQVLDTMAEPESFYRLAFASSVDDLAQACVTMLVAAAEGTLDGDSLVSVQRVTADNADAFRLKG